jgi:organic radical activating enzyme
MPCYEVRTVSVEFKVSNIDLLKKALEKAGFNIAKASQITLQVRREGEINSIIIDLEQSKILSRSFDEKELSTISNQIKRAYSEQVIDEVAKRQKWMKKKLGDNRYQLQRF